MVIAAILTSRLISDLFCSLFSKDTIILRRAIIRNQEVDRNMAYSKLGQENRDIDGEGEGCT